jgi:hypothetical protein
MSAPSSSSGGVKQFLTEEQLDIERQRRQADWERVRSSNDPVGNRYFLVFFHLFSIEFYAI